MITPLPPLIHTQLPPLMLCSCLSACLCAFVLAGPGPAYSSSRWFPAKHTRSCSPGPVVLADPAILALALVLVHQPCRSHWSWVLGLGLVLVQLALLFLLALGSRSHSPGPAYFTSSRSPVPSHCHHYLALLHCRHLLAAAGPRNSFPSAFVQLACPTLDLCLSAFICARLLSIVLVVVVAVTHIVSIYLID